MQSTSDWKEQAFQVPFWYSETVVDFELDCQYFIFLPIFNILHIQVYQSDKLINWYCVMVVFCIVLFFAEMVQDCIRYIKFWLYSGKMWANPIKKEPTTQKTQRVSIAFITLMKRFGRVLFIKAILHWQIPIL